MAKYGEGDKRWIVSDRPDGTNVHNWHWSETDCLDWSRNYLTKSFSNLPILTGESNLYISITAVDKIDGEAYVNIRKGKIIPGYELSVSLSWEGEARDQDGNSLLKTNGTVLIPYIADENAGEDPEVKVTVNDVGPIGGRLKEALLGKGKEVICEKVRDFVECMAKGGPCKVGPNVGPSSAQKEVKKEQLVVEKEKEKEKEEKKKSKERKGFKTIKMSERFSCRAVDLYEIMMDENRWKGFTQSNARISRDVGGEFSIFDGSVMGTNVDLQHGKLIVQKWRFGSWPDGVFSTVKLTFEEPEPGVTIVKLVQTDVPEEDRYGNETVVENTERGWRDLIFHKIRAIFGFGL